LCFFECLLVISWHEVHHAIVNSYLVNTEKATHSESSSNCQSSSPIECFLFFGHHKTTTTTISKKQQEQQMMKKYGTDGIGKRKEPFVYLRLPVSF